MTTTTDPDAIESSLRALVDARMDAGRALARTAAERDARRAALEAVETEYAAQHAAAVTAGWTATELKKVGLEEPTTRTPRTRRRTRTKETAPSTDQT